MMAARLYNIDAASRSAVNCLSTSAAISGHLVLAAARSAVPVLCQPRGRRSKVCWDSAAVLSTDKSHAKPVRIPFKRVGLGAKRAGLLTVCLNPDKC
jgi:hypothetical protein